MLKPVNRIKERLTDSNRGFKERVFLLLTLVTDVVAILALVGDIFLGENEVEIVALIVTIVCIPFITLVAVKTNKVSLAAILVVAGLCFVLLPILFYFGGGAEGGGVIWIVFTYLYAGLVLSGKWKGVALAILTIESCGFYLHAYFTPRLIRQHSRREFYVDALISIILVGIICCMMVWFEEWLYGEENKRAKEETKKVEEMRRAQSRFFSSMSHEIRTPINSILGLNEIILRQEDASEEIVKDAENIRGAGKMLLALVNDILDLSKIEADKMDIVSVNYDLGDMVSEIVNMIWLLAEQKGLEFKVEVDPSTPAGLFGDEVRIKQILVNILNNAVKYTKEGSVTFHIQAEEIQGERVHMLFSVTDTGVGIKQDAIPYLFDAFKRTDEERNTGIEGTGLGLSIVKQLVDLMGGEITVNSVYTQGSNFVVSLWQGVAGEAKVGNINITNYGSRMREGRYVSAFTAPDAKLLIVDDNEMNLEVEKKLLAGTGIHVDTALSGEEALARTINERYDIIFMDHLMPEMDGIECMQSIRRQIGGLNNHVPIIVLTANAGGENRVLYEKSGFDGHLVKPVSGHQLEECLLEYLPEEKVSMTEGRHMALSGVTTADAYSKKLSIAIATNSMSDLPDNVIKNCQIDIIPFKLSFNGKTYYDRIEASTDELVRYMNEGVDFDIAPPSVEEFEEFFAKEIKKAHHVIYISLAGSVSHEYENACMAARAYGNVTIFHSGTNSGAVGMLALLAYKLSSQGKTTENIIEALGEMKKNIRCTFMTDDIIFLSRRGMLNRGIYRLMHIFSLKPMVVMSDNKLTVRRFFVGELEESYEKYIDAILSKKTDPDLDLCFVSHPALPEHTLNRIKEMISARKPFSRIVFQKSSGANALSCGSGALSISFVKNGGNAAEISGMFVQEPAEKEDITYVAQEPAEKEDIIYADHEPAEVTEAKKEKKWYDEIAGIDPATALTYCSSEDDLRDILKTFHMSVTSKADEIERCYKADDWDNYVIKVHALKSTSKLIGANELSQLAKTLEFAGKEKNIGLIREKTDKLLEDYRAFKQILEPFAEKKLPEKEQVSFDADRVSELLDELATAMRELDMDIADSVVSRLSEYECPPEFAGKLKLIKDAVMNVDDEEAIKYIEEARGLLQ